MTTCDKRSLFIAPLVDGAVEFIKARGAVTFSELAQYLEDAGVDVRGDDELTGQELAYYRRNKDFAALSVIATGSGQFVLITLALLVNRAVELDSSNPKVGKLKWAGWDVPEGIQPECKSRTGGHYHVLFVRDPGGPEQVAQCRGADDLRWTCEYVEEIFLGRMFKHRAIDEGWEGIWIVGCGPDRCRRDEICDLPVEEWGKPYWGGHAVYAAAAADDDENPYLVPDVDAEEPPF